MSAKHTTPGSEALQLSLPGTDDVHFLLNCRAFCACECEECPPWWHEKSFCSSVCESQRTEKTPLTNRGVI